jgi:nucleoside-diphosphate-sugar epimerase
LPISAVINQQPIICAKEAPMINHIHIDDLIAIAYQTAQLSNSIEIFNVADGNPEPMGKINCILAEIMKLPPPPMISLDQALAEASEIKREFILSSKHLAIAKLQQKLAIKLQYPDLTSGIKAIMIATNYPSCK